MILGSDIKIFISNGNFSDRRKILDQRLTNKVKRKWFFLWSFLQFRQCIFTFWITWLTNLFNCESRSQPSENYQILRFDLSWSELYTRLLVRGFKTKIQTVTRDNRDKRRNRTNSHRYRGSHGKEDYVQEEPFIWSQLFPCFENLTRYYWDSHRNILCSTGFILELTKATAQFIIDENAQLEFEPFLQNPNIHVPWKFIEGLVLYSQDEANVSNVLTIYYN